MEYRTYTINVHSVYDGFNCFLEGMKNIFSTRKDVVYGIAVLLRNLEMYSEAREFEEEAADVKELSRIIEVADRYLSKRAVRTAVARFKKGIIYFYDYGITLAALAVDCEDGWIEGYIGYDINICSESPLIICRVYQPPEMMLRTVVGFI